MNSLILPPYLKHDPSHIQKAVRSVFCKMDYEISTRTQDHNTTFDGAMLGSIDVLRYGGFGSRWGNRTLKHIHQDYRDDFIVTVPLEADVEILQGGKIVRLDPGYTSLLSTKHPFEAVISNSRDSKEFSALQVRIAGPQLRLRVPEVDRYCNQPFSLDNSLGRMMLTMFDNAIAENRDIRANESAKLSILLIEMISSAILTSTEIGFNTSRSEDATAKVFEAKLLSFIESHLSTPGLNVDYIADHCQISVWRIRNYFKSRNETLSAYIRDRRLDCCKEALSSKTLSGHSVFEIALRWGFNDPAYFSRAYKNRFGVSPTQDRRNTQG